MMRTRFSFAGPVVLLILAFLLSACYPNPAPAGLTPVPTLAGAGATVTPVSAVTPQPTRAPGEGGNAGQGQTLFAQACVACHGPGGQGGQVGPKLAANQFVQGSEPKAVHDTIANGRPGTAMPAFDTSKGGAFSQQQIDDLVAYVRSLK